MALLQVENLSFTYPNGHKALENVSFSLEEGSFTVLCGASGSGKSTLLRLLKTAVAPMGERGGTIAFDGQSYPLPARVDAADIGFVGQDPDAQIVTDRVWHELAFGLENLGLDSDVIHRRVGEMASYFGMESWFEQETDTLSGGQKQQLNLAAALVTRPRLLLLDEPTAQLDPIAAMEFLARLHRLHRDMGLTVFLVEHRLDDVLAMVDKVLMLEMGHCVCADTPRAACDTLCRHGFAAALPTPARVWHALNGNGDCPLTVREGRRFLASLAAPREEPIAEAPETDPLVICRDVWFRYERKAPDVLRGLSLNIRKGEIYSLFGGNGAGKTTLLHAIAGLTHIYKGNIYTRGRVAYLPQDPRLLFVRETVRGELEETACNESIESVALAWGIEGLLESHPYDLSGGEQQRVALAKLMLTKPDVLLLDEPTKGLDVECKRALVGRLREMAATGVSVLLVTHDADFAAEVSDRCGLLFGGRMLGEEVPRRFFGDHDGYTTAASRMSRGMVDATVTCEQVIRAWAAI